MKKNPNRLHVQSLPLFLFLFIYYYFLRQSLAYCLLAARFLSVLFQLTALQF